MSATAAPPDPAAGTQPPKPERPDVFFSYSRKDATWVLGLIAELEERGKDVWVDSDDIRATAVWRNEIAAGIDASDSFAFVITPDSLDSEECGRELAHALEQGKRIVPLLRRDPDGKVVPTELESRNWIFCRDADDYDSAVSTLVEALETDLEWVRAHTRLLVRAREWEQRKGEKSLLLRGADLRDAEQELASIAPGVEPQPTPLQREFVLASRRGQSRRQRITLGGVATGLGVTAVLAVLAILARNDAIDNERTARSRELATAAAGQLETDPEQSALLAREAVELKPTREAEDVLRRALSQTNSLAVTPPHGGWASGVSFSSDGRRILTPSRDATARVSDANDGRTLVVLRGHRNWVPSARFSPDDRRIVTASSDGTARIWDARSGRALLTLSGHRGRVSRAEFSPDGSLVLTAGLDATARIWDARTGEQLRVLRGHRKWVTRAEFSPDGRLVATASDDGTARLWDARSAQQLRVLDPGEGLAQSVAFSPDSRLVAAGGFDGGLVLAPATATGRVTTLRGHVDQVVALAFSPDGKRLASGSADTSARVWDVAGGRAPRVLRGHGDVVTAVDFNGDGSVLATASGDATGRLWDTSGTEVAALRGHRAWVTSITFAPDDRRVATASADRTARVWDATLGASRAVLRTPGNLITAVEYSRDGRLLGTTGIPGQVWNANAGRVAATLLPGAAVLAFSRDGRRVAAATALGDVAIHDAASGRIVASPPDHEGAVSDVEVSPNGRLVATASKDGIVHLSRASNGAPVATLKHTGPVNAVAFSPDSTLLATASDDDLARLFNTRTGRAIAGLEHPQEVQAVAFSPDGKSLATGGNDEAVRLWTTDGRSLAALRYHTRPILALTFSDDGRLLVSTSSDTSARIWDVRARRGIADLRHGGPVPAADFAPGGRFLATASWDRTARIWEVATGRQLARLWGHPSILTDVEFDPTGRWVATAAFPDDAARLFACDVCGSLEDLLAFAETRIGRELTPEERARFMHEEG